MSNRYLTKPEHNAILAGLRCLQQLLDEGGDLPQGVQDILDDGLDHVPEDCDSDPIDSYGIDELCEDINSDSVQFTVEGED